MANLTPMAFDIPSMPGPGSILQTAHLRLLPHTVEHYRVLLVGTGDYARRFGLRVADGVRDMASGPEVSPEFKARLDAAPAPDPWTDGYAIVHQADQLVIGLCGYTGPPGEDGVVEIGYGIAPGYRGSGHATEAARALVACAFTSDQVHRVRAHTLPEPNASTRVLTKCGFVKLGEIMHPEDGPVWRWERRRTLD